eukprot:SAG31_NODE_1357_length_8647_cov_8.257838_7_plen_182_part_00
MFLAAARLILDGETHEVVRPRGPVRVPHAMYLVVMHGKPSLMLSPDGTRTSVDLRVGDLAVAAAGDTDIARGPVPAEPLFRAATTGTSTKMTRGVAVAVAALQTTYAVAQRGVEQDERGALPGTIHGDTFSISALHLAIKVPYFSNSGHKNEKVTSYLIAAEPWKVRGMSAQSKWPPIMAE